MKSPDDRTYFFDAGVRFNCTRCGRCCTGAPGRVRVTYEEQHQIAESLGISRKEFAAVYVRPFSEDELRERPDGRCIFHNDGCRIYDVRPAQCRTYPFWLKNLRSEQAWRETARNCPGIGEGRLHDREEILQMLQRSPL